MSIETQQQLARDFVSEVVARFGIDATTSAATDRGRRYLYQRRGREPRAAGRSQGRDGGGLAGAHADRRAAAHRRAHEQDHRRCRGLSGATRCGSAPVRLRGRRRCAPHGVPEALEPMSPSDRKVVHDTVNELDGVETTSEGIEPRRYVVIRPTSTRPRAGFRRGSDRGRREPGRRGGRPELNKSKSRPSAPGSDSDLVEGGAEKSGPLEAVLVEARRRSLIGGAAGRGTDGARGGAPTASCRSKTPGGPVLELGSGGGLPGLALPSTTRGWTRPGRFRTSFRRVPAAGRLRSWGCRRRVEVLHARAEDAGHGRGDRGRLVRSWRGALVHRR